VWHSGVGHGPAGNVCQSAANSNDAFTSRAALHLSATTVLTVEGSKEQLVTQQNNRLGSKGVGSG